jgi:hypothetical protein
MLRIATTLAFLLGFPIIAQAKPVKSDESWRPWFYQEPVPAQGTAKQAIKAKKTVNVRQTKQAISAPRKAKQKLVAKKPQVAALPSPKAPTETVQAPPKPEIMAPDVPPPPLPKVLQASFDPFGNIIDGFRKFLERTSQFIQGHTMTMQGMEKSLGWLEPKFRENLAKAIYQARQEGFDKIGVFSAYRQPNMGVGGFGRKELSCHAYGLAIDISGIGNPGSKQAIRFHQIAKEHGVLGVYGPYNNAEFNHFQHVSEKVCGAVPHLRKTITMAGPINVEKMWAAGAKLASANLSDKSITRKKHGRRYAALNH